MKQNVRIEGIDLHLSHPVEVKQEWIGQKEPMTQLMACWLKLSDRDFPLTPRLIGPPGLGKTTLAMTAAKERGQEVFIMQCTADTRPEDLLITPVLAEGNRIRYHASSLVTAMLQGGIAVLDEGNRMSEKSWASLAGLLDDRRSVESLVAGVTLKAHPEFRCCVTMNEDSSTFEIPDYIMSRLQPAIELPFPEEAEEALILRYNLPDAPEELINICVGYLQQAHRLDLPYSIRDGLNAIRFATKLNVMGKQPWDRQFQTALKQILGEEALDLEALAEKRRREGVRMPNMELGDFFFEDEDPLNPDNR